jgi:hypothetical protein
MLEILFSFLFTKFSDKKQPDPKNPRKFLFDYGILKWIFQIIHEHSEFLANNKDDKSLQLLAIYRELKFRVAVLEKFQWPLKSLVSGNSKENRKKFHVFVSQRSFLLHLQEFPEKFKFLNLVLAPPESLFLLSVRNLQFETSEEISAFFKLQETEKSKKWIRTFGKTNEIFLKVSRSDNPEMKFGKFLCQ